MVFENPKVLDPLNELEKKLGKLNTVLLDIEIIVNGLRDKFPFTEDNVKEIKRIIRGKMFARTRHKLTEMIGLDDEISETEGFKHFESQPFFAEGLPEEAKRGGLRKSSLFSKAKKDWEINQRRVYREHLRVWLSYTGDGIIMTKLNENKFSEITNEDMTKLSAAIAGYLAIVKKATSAVKDVKVNYQVRGMVVF